ncbi:MAG: hypothetical protein U9Q99_02550 [Nanoarchaeota archaeon]|nr:hypothetical protein [Nanoarchaeota archaeon]
MSELKVEFNKSTLKCGDFYLVKKRDKKLFKSFEKKVFQIIGSNLEEINHFKNLKKPLNNLKRVHVGSFVLTFQFKNNIIFFEDFVHYDYAY